MPHTWGAKVVSYPRKDVARYRAEGYWGRLTVPQEFRRIADRTPEAPALFDADGCMTFRELDQASDRVACGLRSHGLEPADTVLLQLGNCKETVVVWYGLLKAGAIPVCMLPAHRSHEVEQIADLVRPRAHIVQADLPKLDLVSFARQMAADHCCLEYVITTRSTSQEAALRIEDLAIDLDPREARVCVDDMQSEVDPDDVAVLQLSGGTTGTPKLIPRLHVEYWYNARAFAERVAWESTVRMAHPGPVMHNGPIVCGLHAAHSVGAAFVLGTLNADTYLPLLRDAAATEVLLMPGWVAELRLHRLFPEAFASVRHVLLAGAKVPSETFRFFEDLGIEVLQVFGTGEGLVMATPPGAPAAVRATTVGWPVSADDEVRLLETESESLVPPGAAGELCARGPYTIRGYFDAADRNAVAFTSDAFYRTGDVACAVDIDGYRCYTIEGRTKDLVQRGGEKINAEEIEALLADHPAIRQAVLVAMPDDRLGERACAYVILQAGAETVDLTAIQRYMDERQVAKFKWPERVEIVDRLPLTSVDKVDKRALRMDIEGKLARETASDRFARAEGAQTKGFDDNLGVFDPHAQSK